MTEKAGPELDAKLAEALGWIFHRPHPDAIRPEVWDTWHKPSGERMRCSDWQPSRDVGLAISAAEEWCDKQDRPTWFVLESASPGFRSRAEVRQGAVTIGRAEAETLAHALTLALLAALQSEGSK